MAITSANQLELLQTAEAVAREKMIDPGVVVEAMEESLARAAKSRYGADLDIRVKIDRKTGRATFTRVRTVADPEAIENFQAEVDPDQARQIVAQARPEVVVLEASAPVFDEEGNEVERRKIHRFILRAPTETDRMLMEGVDQSVEPQVGDEIIDEVPPVEMGRIAAQSAKQVILQRVREAERERQYEEFKDRVGTIINGIVKREEYGNIIVDVGRGEAVLRRNDKIGRESYRPGDRIRAWVKDVRRENRGPQIFLSRTAPEFMAELFKMEVPEIYDGIIEIKAVARDPGSRAKIAVVSHDPSIDPVGACVGMRGSRVQAVVNELQGERIDIIPWNEDQATFLVNALQPAEVSKVVIDEEAGKIEVVVPEDQLSLAIGRRGQNVRLASQLTGLDIDIMTEEEESQRRQAEFAERTKLFMDALDLDEFFAQLLVAEGFTSLEEVAYVDPEELLVIEGIDEETVAELQARARDVLEEQNRKALERARELGLEDSLAEFPGLTPQMLEALAEEGIKTLEDFATCADWELAGGWTTVNGERHKDEGILEKFDVSLEEAQQLVMNARVQLGWVDPAELETGEEEAEAVDGEATEEA
ncbi:NusA antitermination factor [Meinhardsimonia xiamenensis]|jgi:N utilization substance protein A|uniref:Transcription termination/antitermination protein NusA n=1 Tax=Meinhardsimonia xiamenensis TaxID=990712 RepID=A0A1G8Y1W9_9RHOB|nr:transcription termination factor NusA [Meinhardsimonia xiamenensis]PRX37125.1 NusA antitermination factor [Meinhardsimonia xiamenensis]SDJ96444.1 NusA antitermination factor [Meinhardsimonia xiamenensis]